MAIVNRKQLAKTLGVSERWVIQLRTDGVIQSTDEFGRCFDEEAAVNAFQAAKHQSDMDCASRRNKARLAKLMKDIWNLTEEEREILKEDLKKPGSGASVYFLRSGRFVKIGYSTNPNERFRQHSVSNPDLETLAIIPGTRSTERELHNKFEHLRHNREWFHLTEDLRAAIQGLAAEAKEQTK
jgi:T5orf172 domain